MCNRHSFCVTPEGRVLDGLGLTDSVAYVFRGDAA